MDLNIIITSFLPIIVPIMIALLEIIKKINFVKERTGYLVPIISIILGTILSFLNVTADIKTTIMVGLIIGLSSCGLYDFGSGVISNSKK